MQRDKAALSYHGKPQLQWTYELLSEFTAATFISVRPDQREEDTRRSLPQIVDRRPGIGPLAGIEAALLSHPKAAWLVVACDLPFITVETLRYLTEQRDATRTATAFRSAHDDLPEPLCAIWEPRSREQVLAAIATGKQCPRKVLINSDARLLNLPHTQALDNVNTTVEFGAAQSALQRSSADRASSGAAHGAPIKVRVQYFALFREQAGRSEEFLSTTATTPAALYAELQARYPFTLAPEQLKVAINTDFRDWSAALADGDTVVFIPPVAGG
jgi:molybdopterin-guanine dinucleotide biosynthesis protein A